ncbi:hypothetical protein EMCRGX_G029204, partial [Ephydatia muelleri]
QKLSSPPLMPWVGVDYNGTVLCAHCNCMAGVGEACSHIAALLYFVRTKANLNKQASCTSKLYTWLQPSHKNEATYATIADVDFTSPLKSFDKFKTPKVTQQIMNGNIS